MGIQKILFKMLKGVMFSTSLRGGESASSFSPSWRRKEKGEKSQYLMSWDQRGEEEGTDLFFYCRPSKSSWSAQAKEGGTMTLTNWLWRKKRGEGSSFSLSSYSCFSVGNKGGEACCNEARWRGGGEKMGKTIWREGWGWLEGLAVKKEFLLLSWRYFFLGWGQSNFLSLFWKKLDSKSNIFPHKESKYEQHWLWRMAAFRALADFETIWYVRLQFDPWCPLYPHFEVWGAQAGVGRLLQFLVFQATDFPNIYNAKS